MRVLPYIFLAIFLVGCAPKSGVDNYQIIESFDDENLTYEIDSSWHKNYNQIYLNSLVDRALVANSDLKISALNITRAFANAGVISADFFPTFSADYRAGASRDTDQSDSDWKQNYNANVALSYELDIFGKIRDSVNEADWEANATIFDLQSLKLSVINSVVDGYFKQLFINDSLYLLDESLKNYKNLRVITKAKLDLGRDLSINLLELDKSILSFENRILSLKKDKFTNEQLLRNLLNLKPDERLDFDNLSLKNVKLLGVNLDVPYYALNNRPDLQASISRINSSFYGYKIRQKAFYPSITIGASLGSNANNFDNSFGMNLLSGNLRINLPFLDYARLKQRLIIGELEFQRRVLEHEKALIKALNEMNLYYKDYEFCLLNLQNFQNIIDNNAQLSAIYLERYNAGRIELKDYLEAKNNEINTKITYIQERYRALNSEILVYKSMAGKFRNR